MKAWKAALAAAIATAAIALIVVAPMAQSSKSHPGLRLVTVDEFGSRRGDGEVPEGIHPNGRRIRQLRRQHRELAAGRASAAGAWRSMPPRGAYQASRFVGRASAGSTSTTRVSADIGERSGAAF